jgi:hypothetical protein
MGNHVLLLENEAIKKPFNHLTNTMVWEKYYSFFYIYIFKLFLLILFFYYWTGWEFSFIVFFSEILSIAIVFSHMVFILLQCFFTRFFFSFFFVFFSKFFYSFFWKTLEIAIVFLHVIFFLFFFHKSTTTHMYATNPLQRADMAFSSY